MAGVKNEKVSPFAWVDALCKKDADPMAEHGESAYPAFMVNRAMSQYPDCVFMANEMNMYQDLDSRMQYDYYMNGIRKGKRFAKWGKKKTADDETAVVMKHYQVNRERAEEYLKLLTDDQLSHIKELESDE